jgi:hypothetical protein
MGAPAGLKALVTGAVIAVGGGMAGVRLRPRP